MFEATKLGRSLSKGAYREQVGGLRTDLLEAQRQIAEAQIPVVVIVSGVDGAGKGEVVNRLTEWLDTRGVETYAFWDESDEDRERPRYWRFWRALPPRGRMAILFGGWYLAPIEHRFRNLCNDAELDAELNRIVDFENLLTQDGTLILKFWCHLTETEQRVRLKQLARNGRSRWKTMPAKSKFAEHYSQFERVAERIIRHTDRGIAPWYLIEAADPLYRDVTIGKTLLEAIKGQLHQVRQLPDDRGSRELSLPEDPAAQVTLLDHLDLQQRLSPERYAKELDRLQGELNSLAWQAHSKKRSTVLVTEGMDAAGKGGAIRRITAAVDARLYRTIPVAAPTEEEKAHHYLWRFWRHIPRAGYMTLYDRSWYGRVLVERVEGFASETEWRRAYAEINQFEEQLVESGVILCKFWLQISDEEQLRRFKAREETPYKQFKITEEDWRNRDKSPLYRLAVNEMVDRTSTESAAWTLVEGDDKLFARIKMLRTLTETLRDALSREPSGGGYLTPCGKARRRTAKGS